MKPRRINFVAGSGSGKSTLAHSLYPKIKTELIGHSIEFIKEHVKTMAYENKVPSGFDQFRLLEAQLTEEEIPLKNGVDLVVCESPLFLCSCYSIKYGAFVSNQITEIAKAFENIYPSINIFVKRPNDYVQHGRFQKHQEAIEMDEFIIKFHEENGIRLHYFNYNDINGIFELIKTELEKYK